MCVPRAIRIFLTHSDDLHSHLRHVLVLTSPIRPYIPCYTCLYDAQILVPNASAPHFDVAVVLLQGAGIDASAYVPLLQRLQVDGASATGSRTAVWAGCPQCVYYHPSLARILSLYRIVLNSSITGFAFILHDQILFSQLTTVHVHAVNCSRIFVDQVIQPMTDV